MIYRELNPVLDMTIAENIWLGREPRRGQFVDYVKMYQDTQALRQRLNIPYGAHGKMYELSIAGHQLVEIAKAISCNTSIIIMDEPSSAIGDEEIDILFKHIFSLREQGVTILYIIHGRTSAWWGRAPSDVRTSSDPQAVVRRKGRRVCG